MFQLTGKENYQGLTDWYEKTYKTKVDFVTNPDLVLSKDYLLLSAVYFWLKYDLHEKADNGDKGEHVDKITEVINKKTKTYKNRRENFEKIKKEKVFDSISFE
jgi:predicted chitinase